MVILPVLNKVYVYDPCLNLHYMQQTGLGGQIYMTSFGVFMESVDNNESIE